MMVKIVQRAERYKTSMSDVKFKSRDRQPMGNVAIFNKSQRGVDSREFVHECLLPMYCSPTVQIVCSHDTAKMSEQHQTRPGSPLASPESASFGSRARTFQRLSESF